MSSENRRKISHSNQSQTRLMFFTQLIWLVTIFALIGWWGFLLHQQAGYIEGLEKLSPDSNLRESFPWLATRTMIIWESIAFIVLLLTSTSIVFWLYWRDVLRTKGLHAFFASITHELKTPLASIRLQAESLVDSKGESQKTLINRLLGDTVRLETQVERMLELARLEEGGKLLSQEVALKPLLQNIIENDLRAISDKVNIQNNTQDVRVVGDFTAIRAIFRNIIENSAKHAKTENLEIQISTEHSDEFLKVRFTDNGTELSEMIRQEELGQLFSKGDRSKGAGVGLYLVRTLMERMGGRADFQIPNSQQNTGFQSELWFHEAKYTDT